MSNPKLFVTGASGQLGQQVLHHLVNTLGVPGSRIVAGTRSPERLGALLEQGIQTVAFDFDDPAGMQAALQGAERMLLVSGSDIGRRIEQHQAAIRAAEAAGVQHVVYTSMPKPETSKVSFAPEHAGTEAALEQSGLPGWTVLRNHWYFENIFMSLGQLKASGTWYTAAGEGENADISREDLAHAAAVALTRSTGRSTYTLSGPEGLSVPTVARAYAEVLGQPIEVVQLNPEQLEQGMLKAGLPEPVAKMLVSFDVNTAAGLAAEVTSDYERLVGKAPTSFASWLQANADRVRSA